MSKELLEVARQAVQAARKAGAEGSRVVARRERRGGVEWRDGKLDRLTEATERQLSVTLLVAGRYSWNSTSDLRPDALTGFIGESVAATRLLAPDLHRKLPPPELCAGVTKEELELCDETVVGLRPEVRLAIVRDLEEATRAGEGADKLISVSCSFGDSVSDYALVASDGLERTARTGGCGLSASAVVGDRDNRKPSGWAGGSARWFSDLPAVAGVGREALRRALDEVGSHQAPTGKYELLVENRAAGNLAGHLLAAMFGGAVQQRQSFLEGKLEQQIAASALTLVDDPHVVRGLGSAKFDGEGMTTRERLVLDRGVLKLFYLDTYYASKLGIAPTSSGSFNLLWSDGGRKLEEMVADIGRGVLVTSFLGGNSNRTTGDFSLGIKGRLIKDGKLDHPVSEMNMAGNHLQLWRNLVELGNDPYPWSSNRIPSLRFEAVDLSGNG